MRSTLKTMLICVIVSVCSGPLTAQTPTDTAVYYLQPVISIATKTSEPWIQVPLSVSYILRQDIPKGKGYGLDEVLSNIPGVLVQSRFGNQDVRLTIRGFGARGAGERSNAGTTRGVRILNNGFPDTEPDGRTALDLVNISSAGRIEVLRSNASSIYGNASGGVINIASNTFFDAPYASYSQSFGSFGFRKELFNTGAMLSTDSRLYVSISNTNFDGWRWHSRSSQALLNTGIVADVSERTNIGVHLSATSNIFRIPGPLTLPQYNAEANQADSLYIKRDERRYNRLGRIGVTASHSLDDHNLIAATAFVQPKFLQRSERNTFRDFNRYHVGGSAMYGNTTSFGAEVQNKLLIGADEAYQDGAILFYELTASGNRDITRPLRDNKREGANTFGAYVQDEVEFGNHWLVLLGARYDNITYYADSFIQLNRSESRSFEHITPKAGITYRLSPMHSVYANLGGGVEVPAGNETDPVSSDTIHALNPLLEPITSTTIEIGTKQIISLGGSAEPFANLTYDAAAYWLRVTNDIIPYRNGRFYFTAGRTERMGVEVGGHIRFQMGLTANVAVTASSNKYKEYTVDSLHYGNPGKVADFSNHKVVGVPDLYFTVGLKYAIEALSGAYAGVNIQHVGKYYADDANRIEVPAYTIANASVGIDRLTIGERLYAGASLSINNVTDAKYVGSAWLNPDVNSRGEPMYIEPGLLRNVVASGSIGWNF